MSDAGKWMMIGGLILAAAGGVIWVLGRSGFRGLPGDIQYESPNVRFYFPIVTSLLVSIVLTLALWIWSWLGRK